MNLHSTNLKLQILTNNLCEEFGLPHIKIVLSEQNNNRCYGEYFYEDKWIAIYSKVRNKVQSVEELVDTMCHELAHHYQYFFKKDLEHSTEFTKIHKQMIHYVS